jgi:hypothetical protein
MSYTDSKVGLMFKMFLSALFFVTSSFSPTYATSPDKKTSTVKRSPQSLEDRNDLTNLAIQNYLSGIQALPNQNPTYAKSWTAIRDNFPFVTQAKIDYWMKLHGNEKLPQIEILSFKGTDKKTYYNLLASHKNSTLKITLNNKGQIKFNDKPIVLKQTTTVTQLMEKIAKLDPKMAKAEKEFEEQTSDVFNPTKKPELLSRARDLLFAAERVHRLYANPEGQNESQYRTHPNFINILLCDYAYAGPKSNTNPKDGVECIMAGYIAKYENGKCGGGEYRNQERADLDKYHESQCNSKQVACNPIVFGLNSGSLYCVDGSNQANLNSATDQCAEKSPNKTPEQKLDIIQSLSKTNFGLKDNKILDTEKDKLKEHLDRLNEYVENAAKLCGQPPLKPIAEKRKDQEQACKTMKTRKIDFDTYVQTPPVVVKPPEPVVTPPVELTCEQKGNCPVVKEDDTWKWILGILAAAGVAYALSNRGSSYAVALPKPATPLPTPLPIVVPPIVPVLPPTEGGTGVNPLAPAVGGAR